MARKKKADADSGTRTGGDQPQAEQQPAQNTEKQTVERFGQARGDGGPGAAGATVGGPIHYAVTEGGTKPMPDSKAGDSEVEPTAGAEAGDHPTTQAAAAESGDGTTQEQLEADETVQGAKELAEKAEAEPAGDDEPEPEQRNDGE